MNSNITLKSNVYVNKTSSNDDIEFLRHIVDYRVLKSYTRTGPDNRRTTAWMTSTQQEILRLGMPNCSLEHGTMSWGVPVGSDRFVCRCEEYSCTCFDKMCSRYANYEAVNRETVSDEPQTLLAEDITPLPLFVENDAIGEPSDAINDKTEVEYEDEDISEPALMARKEMSLDENQGFDENNADHQTVQDAIINAGIQERIWVNAGPGTGKTYTVIQRLEKLLTEDWGGVILVLCFSRNAVQVIRDRLYEAIGFQVDALINEGRLLIRTLDSFASYMLDDELDPASDYNARIEQFIQAVRRNPSSLNEVRYLIVDEIQDTVGVRARMLLTLLDELSCGVLLLGDRCQAIFDWAARDADDMLFEDFAEELRKRNWMRYELTENHRQAGELAQKERELREVMLTSDEAAQEDAVDTFKRWVNSKWKSYSIKALPQFLSGLKELVLCKTNGEAAHISQILFENAACIPHAMKQESNHQTLAPWIAKLLYCNDGHVMEKRQFFANADDYGVDNPDEKWHVLKGLDGHDRAPGLHIPEVLAALSRMDDLPDICLNLPEDSTIVSTIHRAKGSEAEHVFWLDSPLVYESQQDQPGALSDALKAAYVAATRAKTDVHILEADKQFWMLQVDENRWIQTGLSRNGKRYCRGIALQPEDVDMDSFADMEFAQKSQAVLACLEPGTPVDLYPNASKKCFEIYYEGQMIGRTSKALTNALFSGFEKTNKTRNWPESIRNAYITTVTTVIASSNSNVDERYRTSGCWLGIELGGLPRLEWY